ncbi:MAG: FADH(2)-oxidizing methylenetetrahydrofolate--tRNA-(uracil(54)-C(5))-methyltransferase TrmFO [Planctomycetota bacterium]|nr:MAG: FADH(2)-oxidizing methylenetetrahydrofolate--tRNA-(uracil(54)-C(5))-methyltransferase TrmFO [Planctomycetota bacterium]
MSALPDSSRCVTVIGGGLAGTEAARVLSRAGVHVRLFEMRPVRGTPAHQTGDLAELVCSNSLGGTGHTTGKGLLLAELGLLDSLIVESAKQAAVPAGSSLAVDRERFAEAVAERVALLPNVELMREEAARLPESGPVICATGPLTSDALAKDIAALTESESLFFYDAIAPIVTAESIDHEVAYAASRYDKGTPDFLNLPLSESDYEGFIDNLLAGDMVEPKDFEEAAVFEGCMPLEVMASRGRRTLAFGPLRPVGLPDPRTGQIPHAVVQLRREDVHGQLYNLVGFQTKLRWPEQKRIFRTLPGMADAEFVRLGSLHRNTFLCSPRLLAPDLSLHARPGLRFAGQITGVEGYAESTAIGLMAALATLAQLDGRDFEPPPQESMIGGLMHWMRTADPKHFQPMNANFGLLPPLQTRIKNKKERREAQAARALDAMRAWAERVTALASA